jgi:hypothetical protein
MDPIGGLWGVVSAVFVLMVGFLFSLRLGFGLGLGWFRVFIIYVWHTLICLFACWYSLNYVSDAIGYYEKGVEGVWRMSVGTGFVELISSIFIWGFGLSYCGLFLVFNVFGVFGLLAFDSSLRVETRRKNNFLKILGTVIVFLPSVSFWSSAIGKDSISFMAVGFALWGSLLLRKRILFVLISVFLMLLVRPHISLIMLIAFAVAIVYDPLFSRAWKVALGVPMMLGLVLFAPFVIDYAGYVDDVSIGDISGFVESRQGFNMDGGGGIDISNMGWVERLLAYMFRPSILEVSSVYTAAAAFDNFLLLILFLWGGASIFKKSKIELGADKVFMCVYAVFVWVLLGMTTSNMGIALRQKWMFAPMIIFLMFGLIRNKKTVN